MDEVILLVRVVAKGNIYFCIEIEVNCKESLQGATY